MVHETAVQLRMCKDSRKYCAREGVFSRKACLEVLVPNLSPSG